MRVRGDILAKRINLRVEHVNHSSSRLSFIDRVHKNEETRKANKAAGTWTSLKRNPRPAREGPRRQGQGRDRDRRPHPLRVHHLSRRSQLMIDSMEEKFL